jgi:hypothetical protein
MLCFHKPHLLHCIILHCTAEMVEEKGLPGPVADRIGEFVVLRGRPMELLARLQDAGQRLVMCVCFSATGML